jgi:hypothetical protein
MQEYNNSDRQIHWLSQVLAKVNRAYVPEREDDSHTNLYFDATGTRILGQWIDGPEGKMILGLNLKSLTFQWLDERQNILSELSVLNKNMQELEAGVSEYPGSLKMSTVDISKALHFDFPDYKISKLNKGDLSDEGFRSWIFYRDLANKASQDLLGYLQLESEICIWPHHFDTGIYSQVSDNLGLGFGLAMKDALIGEAYFYMSGYRGEAPLEYQNLPTLSKGRWENGAQWKGAVLPINDLPDFSGEEAIQVIRVFIKQALGWFLNE